MRRLLLVCLASVAWTGCGGAPEAAPAPATDPAAAEAPAPALPQLRAIDRARDAAASAESRALQHDTIG